MSMIELKNITKAYGSNIVIKDLSFNIIDKEFLILLGPSGCGKTTLMRMIAGLEDITQGEILIENRVVNNLTPRSRRVSMVFQNYSLYPHMSVAENLAYPLLIDGEKKETRLLKTKNVAKIVELENLLDRMPSQLSGGQRQRVALGRAIIKEENEIFLMDEPLSNLDAMLRNTMRSQIKNLHYRLQKTIVYVTHDQVEAMTMATRIVVLNKGIIQQIGTPAEIYAKPANVFVASFIGNPPMNIIKASVSNNELKLVTSSFKVSKPNLPPDVFIGVRPEHLNLANIDNAMFKGKIYAIEFLGEATLITIKLSDNSYLVCKLSQSTISQNPTLNIDDDLGFSCNEELLYFFDTATEKAI